MTTADVRSATLQGTDVRRRRVFDAGDFDQLVEEVLVDGGGVVQRAIYAQDMTIQHPRGWVPDTVLVVTTCEDWGALYFRSHEARNTWISHNARPPADAPVLVFDEQAPASFPEDAVIPVDQIRAALREYLETGQRPTRVAWRESDRAMVW